MQAQAKKKAEANKIPHSGKSSEAALIVARERWKKGEDGETDAYNNNKAHLTEDQAERHSK